MSLFLSCMRLYKNEEKNKLRFLRADALKYQEIYNYNENDKI